MELSKKRAIDSQNRTKKTVLGFTYSALIRLSSLLKMGKKWRKKFFALNSTISRLWGPNNVKVLKWLNSSRLFGLKWLNSSRFCSFWFWLWPDAYNLMNLQTYQRFSFAKCLPRSMIYYVWSSSFAQWKSRLSNILFLTPLIFTCQAIYLGSKA